MLQYKGHNAGNANHVSVEYLSTYKVLGYHMSSKLFEVVRSKDGRQWLRSLETSVFIDYKIS